MLLTILLGIAAGFGAPYAEPHVKKAVDGLLQAEAPMTATELRMFAFAVCLFGAAVLALLIGEDSGIALAFGAALGVFGPRIIGRIQNRRAPDYGDDPRDGE